MKTAALLLAVLALASCGDNETRPAKPARSSLPGAEPFPRQLVQKLEAAKKALPADYVPRTKHLNADGSATYTNRLLLETSPYLRQHAHNPVNWYPWGAEAFEAARKLGRPVLLSIGYSTCHWCHVMEEESFEDETIARYLNENYIAIKVDREERPDVDSIYMNAMAALKLGGGWPLNVWLTPDREPFYGGTYFPPFEARSGRPALLPKLKEARELYDSNPDAIKASAAHVARALEQSSAAPPGSELPEAQALAKAADHYKKTFDKLYGGPQIGRGGSKFPSSMPIRFLLRESRRSGDAELLSMAVLTLEKMAGGGMYDQFGGGFHRYSTDHRWLVPHFEKMLYDNALLAVAYLEAHQVTGRADFARVAREVLGYVVRDMTSPDGAFYSATDADSLTPEGHREEGYYFTWTPAEIDAALDPKTAAVIKEQFDITESGNFEGRSIPNRPRAVPEELWPMIVTAKEALYQERSKRPPPLRDDKILTAWNGLMISAFARAALILGKDEQRGIDYAQHAIRAARFVLDNMQKDGRLLRAYSDGAAKLNAYLQDYSFFVAGLLDLYEATGDARWLAQSIALDETLHEHYEDKAGGGFFLTSDDHEQLLAREKPYYDRAIPSGNSYAVMNLLRLYELTTNKEYLERADKALVSLAVVAERAPTSASELLLALEFRLDSPKEIVIVTPGGREDAAPLLAVLAKTFVPNHVLAVTQAGPPLEELQRLVPLVEAKVPMKGKTTAYVCVRQSCELPTSDPAVFARQLAKTADRN